MKRALTATLVLAALLMAGTLTSCGRQSPREAPRKQVGAIHSSLKLGAVLPLTGQAAIYGQNSQHGIQLAVDAANSQGGVNGRKVEVVFEDSKGDAKTGVAAAHKLTSQDRVPAIFDDAVSSVALAVVPIIDEAKVVLISTGSTNPDLSGRSRYFFRTWNSDTEEGRFSAQFARNVMKWGTGCALYIDNDYGRGLYEVFKRNLEQVGGKVVAAETFSKDDSDFKNQLAKLKSQGGEFLYLVSYPEKVPTILKQIKELGLTHKLIGSTTMEDPKIVEAAGEAAEGLIYPYPVAPSGAETMAFKEAYRKKYGADPGTCCAEGYDNASLIIHCLRQGAASGLEIQEQLRKVKDWPGVSGLITFDDNGDVHKPMQMKVIRKGHFTPAP